MILNKNGYEKYRHQINTERKKKRNKEALYQNEINSPTTLFLWYCLKKLLCNLNLTAISSDEIIY